MIQRITNYDLLRLPVKQGQIYYISDLRCLFQDNGPSIRERTRLNALVLNTDYERLNRIRPQNGKNYYVVETNFLWVYDTKWVLRDGNIGAYNSYTYTSRNGVSPVINTDSNITSSETGDRIIDNNGLLGNGSVVIRDHNRLNKGIINVDASKNNLAFTSYLDNGISFYPYGFTSDSQEKIRIGSLHLGVTSTVENPGVFESMAYKGVATYYGDMNLYGDVYTYEIQPYTSYTLMYVPPSKDEKLRFSFTCSRKMRDSSDVIYDQYSQVSIYNVTETSCKIHIITYNNSSGATVTDKDGNLIYEGALIMDSDVVYEGVRTINTDGSTYKILNMDDAFTFSGSVQQPLVTFSVPSKYIDDGATVYGLSELVKKIKISNYSGQVNILRVNA